MTLSVQTFAVVLGLTGLMRLVEAAVSSQRLRERPSDLVSEPLLFPAMVALHIGLITLPLAEVLWAPRALHPGLCALSISVLLAATALRVWTLRSIGWAWSVRVVRPPGSAIATGGPYRWIRHPNYLVVILEIASLPMLHGAWASALVLSALNGLVLATRIATEERALMAVPEWRTAFEAKYRLIPGLL